MAATAIDTMLQSNDFQAKKKEDVDNKDNLWYVRGLCDVSHVSECSACEQLCFRPFLFGSSDAVLFHMGILREKNSRPTALAAFHLMLSYASQVVYSGGSAEQRQQQATVEQECPRAR